MTDPLRLLLVFAQRIDMAEMHKDAGVAVLAMQGKFYWTFSLLNGGRRIETDLFEGLR